MTAQNNYLYLLTVCNRWILPGIVAGGLFLRLYLIFANGKAPELFEYDQIARNILSGQGYVYNQFGTPYASFSSRFIYIGITALLYAVFPPGYTAVLVAQSVTSALLAVTVFSIGRALQDRHVGLLAALLTIGHPALVYYDTHKLHPLSFDALVISLAVLALLWVKMNSQASRLLFAGMLLGLAILQRGSILLLLPLGLVWLWFFGQREKSSFLRGVVPVYILGVMLVLIPWVARNYMIHGTLLLQSTLGEHFWRGNMPYSYGSSYLPSGQTVFEVAPDTFRVDLLSKSELGQYELFWQSALAVAWEHPLTFTTGVIRKFVYFWTFSPQSGILYPVMFFYFYLVYYLMIATLAVLGAVRLLRDWSLDRSDISALFLIFAVFLSVSVAHSVFYFELRHRWMIEPLILVLSSVCLSSLLSRLGPLRNAEKRIAGDTD